MKHTNTALHGNKIWYARARPKTNFHETLALGSSDQTLLRFSEKEFLLKYSSWKAKFKEKNLDILHEKIDSKSTRKS